MTAFDLLRQRIQTAMADRSLTARGLARAAGRNGMWAYLVLNRRVDLTMRHVDEIAAALGVPGGSFVGSENPSAHDEVLRRLLARMAYQRMRQADVAAALRWSRQRMHLRFPTASQPGSRLSCDDLDAFARVMQCDPTQFVG